MYRRYSQVGDGSMPLSQVNRNRIKNILIFVLLVALAVMLVISLLLNALHDRAFDQGLMTIDQDLRIVLSTQLPKGEFEQRFFWRYKGERIHTPGKFRPRREFIEYHNDVVFRG